MMRKVEIQKTVQDGYGGIPDQASMEHSDGIKVQVLSTTSKA